MTADIQRLARALQAALGVAIVNGQITVNFNAGEAQSVETRTFRRLAKRVPGVVAVDNVGRMRSE